EYAVVRYHVKRGDEPPLHTHTREDELVYVVDRVIADVAAAGADARDGRADEAGDRLARAGHTARRAGDAVARALVAVASSTWLGTGTATDVEHLGPGWRRVVDDLAAMGARPELVDQQST
ncbi:MAG: hypothetical protein AAFY28_19380, partial [Actinomycetota bacterium]